MADEKNGNGGAKTSETKAAATTELTAARIARLVKGKVVVPVIGADGQPIVIRPKEGGSFFKTEELPIAAAHILGFRIDGNEVVATTVDGQKLRASLA